MKRLHLFLSFVLFSTSSFLEAEFEKMNSLYQCMSSFFSLNKLDKQEKKDLVKGGASLILCALSGALYIYKTDMETWRAKYQQASQATKDGEELNQDVDRHDPYNTLDKLIAALIFEISYCISDNNAHRLMEGGSILIAFNSAIYGFKKIASVVKAVRAKKENINS